METSSSSVLKEGDAVERWREEVRDLLGRESMEPPLERRDSGAMAMVEAFVSNERREWCLDDDAIVMTDAVSMPPVPDVGVCWSGARDDDGCVFVDAASDDWIEGDTVVMDVRETDGTVNCELERRLDAEPTLSLSPLTRLAGGRSDAMIWTRLWPVLPLLLVVVAVWFAVASVCSSGPSSSTSSSSSTDDVTDRRLAPIEPASSTGAGSCSCS